MLTNAPLVLAGTTKNKLALKTLEPLCGTCASTEVKMAAGGRASCADMSRRR